MRIQARAALAAALLTASTAALARNTTAEPPSTNPPAGGTEKPNVPPGTSPGTTPIDPAPIENPQPAPAQPSAAPAPVQSAPPPATITLDADVPYPNGFADPAQPYGNEASVSIRNEGGFDWGLLGLLGLLGLFGLRSSIGSSRHVVHSDRYDDGRPTLRR
ncbi:WGxxGxxG-CTERM domain-containing protein [Allosphingosinicella sp.]|jgi:hypothetical protein|uniref:WGxxGxxG-CTERM domain-containing protein n=1 Tax=Allosphingosinicella sp. TaxID=2823234 RepID=UPI002EFA12C9